MEKLTYEPILTRDSLNSTQMALQESEIHEGESCICDVTEEPHLVLQVQEERHDLEMVDSIHARQYRGLSHFW